MEREWGSAKGRTEHTLNTLLSGMTSLPHRKCSGTGSHGLVDLADEVFFVAQLIPDLTRQSKTAVLHEFVLPSGSELNLLPAGRPLHQAVNHPSCFRPHAPNVTKAAARKPQPVCLLWALYLACLACSLQRRKVLQRYLLTVSRSDCCRP